MCYLTVAIWAQILNCSTPFRESGSPGPALVLNIMWLKKYFFQWRLTTLLAQHKDEKDVEAFQQRHKYWIAASLGYCELVDIVFILWQTEVMNALCKYERLDEHLGFDRTTNDCFGTGYLTPGLIDDECFLDND
jgi:hypothetical protein